MHAKSLQSCPALWPHGLQNARLPCLSPSLGVCPNSCSLSRWCHPTISSSASLVPQMVKNLLAKQETRVRSLGWEDLLEKGMAAYSSILAWRIPWTEEPGGLQSMKLQRVRHNWVTNTFTFSFQTTYGNRLNAEADMRIQLFLIKQDEELLFH